MSPAPNPRVCPSALAANRIRKYSVKIFTPSHTDNNNRYYYNNAYCVRSFSYILARGWGLRRYNGYTICVCVCVYATIV